jgi:predicted Zn-dependent protease
MRTKIATTHPLVIACVIAGLALGAGPTFAVEALTEAPQQTVEQARDASDSNPASAPLKYKYAEALKRAGRNDDAIREYLATTEIDPSYYHAYHQITQCSPDAKSLAEAVKRLTHLMADKPKELMLRVALSELLECQGQYFHASKVLVELVYENAVPPKFVTKVNNRIRVLQSKSRGEHANRRVAQDVHSKTDSGDPPLPLPEENLSRGLSASRLEKGQDVDSYGHSALQH